MFSGPPSSPACFSFGASATHGSYHTEGRQNAHNPLPGPGRERSPCERGEQRAVAEPKGMAATGAGQKDSGNPEGGSPLEGEMAGLAPSRRNYLIAGWSWPHLARRSPLGIAPSISSVETPSQGSVGPVAGLRPTSPISFASTFSRAQYCATSSV